MTMETLSLESSDKPPHDQRCRSGEMALAKHSDCEHTKKTETETSTGGSDRSDKSPDRPKANTDEVGDEGSFALFNESFDIASEAGRNLSPVNANDTFALKGPMLTPPETGNRYAKSRRPIEIDLPSLKHNTCDTSECSVGDISPIKVSFNQGATSNRKGEHHRKLPPPPPPPQPHFITQGHEQDLFWQQRGGFDAAHTSNPYYVIRCAQHLLHGCKYYLPCLYDTEVCRVNMSGHGHIRHYQESDDVTSMPADMTIGIRRVEAAICAFGGSIKPDQKMSIFRTNRGPGRKFYEQQLSKRYSVSKSRISWDVEEEPPILCQADQQPPVTPREVRNNTSPSAYTPPNASSSSTTGSQDSGKQGKYRCKQCGQPKQNHDCPYRPSLQRSIGIMVYPAVNSFTAAEPGTIAPPLSKMNNFVSYDSDQGSHYAESTSGQERHVHFPPNTVSPEALRGGFHHHSPQSTLSAQSSSESLTQTTPGNATTTNSNSHNNMSGQKRTHAQAMGSPDRFPFVSSTLTLRPEHYRAVTPAVSLSYYDYPTIPLTFVERKRLSDTLFCLTRQIPYWTSDVGTVLRQARDDWDQAVAELLTQVVIGLYCSEGDTRLDGLQRYLLALGISC